MEEATLTIFAMQRILQFLTVDVILLCMLACTLVLPMDRQLVPTHMRLDANSLGTHFYCVEAMFRATRLEILDLTRRVLPPTFCTSSRDNVNAVEGLCIVMRRLAFPCRWLDLVPVFGRSKGSLSRIFKATMLLLMQLHGHLLDFNPVRFTHRLSKWARKIAAKGAPAILDIVLFIDCTIRGCARPGPTPDKRVHLPPGVTLNMLQQSLFSGNKWKHGLKYQSIVSPNGLSVGCFGPREGRENDCTTLAASGVVPTFALMVSGGRLFRVFGDGIYPRTTQLLRPFINPPPNSPQANFNDVLAKIRVGVEWSFGLVTNTFQAVDFTRWQRCFLTNPALQYRTATFLMNCLSCIRRTNMPAVYFQCALPTLAEYLRGYF